ncbi:glycoside hydrolase family 3 N-terminal domain-containing protein [Dactylosporangium sp. NPDC051485]|uniref:glycoside hydrolase family 3 protein n=1 Tax=Dactylosporangium sp. NPDC051485 TaxID=3154846 RepID=UPI00343D1341
MVVEPYRDPSRSVPDRVEDLLARLTVEDKAGLMFHDIVAMGPGGRLMTADNPFGRPGTETAIRDLRLNHFNLAGQVDDVRALVAWHNSVQKLALATGPGIPVTLSTDPRHAFSNNPGTEALAGAFSQWPQSLGLAALCDADLVGRYADIVRQEYLAAGLRVALHPQIDLATEPRWARVGMTFGEDADLTSRLVTAYIRGLQGAELDLASVAAMTKHFPGGGPQQDGEDPHFAYGREQVYPGGQREYHLAPFRAAIAAGTSQMMPYYGMPVGTEWEEVGFAFNTDVITGLLRDELGFDGIVCTDWGLISDSVILGQPMPARAWGVEQFSELDRAQRIINAGCDQFGGESRPELVVELVRSGRVSEARIDRSVRRLLQEKFLLGLFDRPFLDVERAVATVGRADFVAAGEAAQRAAMVRLTAATSGPATLPLRTGLTVYVENLGPAAAARLGRVVTDPAAADLAVLRLDAPYEPRPGGFEAFFHAGSLEFPAHERDRIVAICRQVPTIIVLFLDRPAVAPEIAAAAAALLVEFGARDDAVVDVLLGHADARGRLPFDLPSSTQAVVDSRTDTPYDTADPLFCFGDGILS